MNQFEELIARIEEVERRLEQMGAPLISVDSIAKRKTITFCVNKEWSTNDMLRFWQAVNKLYGIFLVQSESERDEDCRNLVLEWDKSLDIVLAYRKANDANYTDGHLLIETMYLHPRGLISLRGWTAPIERLHQVIDQMSRHASVKKRTKVAKRNMPRTKRLSGPERRRLVALVLSCLAELAALGVAAG